LTIQYLVYAGTYTHGSSRGIYAARFSPAERAITPLGLAGEMEDPSFLCLHPRLPVLYAVSEVKSYGGNSTGAVMSWRIDSESGKLTLIGERATGGRGPCHVAVDADASMVMVANYVDGSVISYPIAKDGALREPGSFFRHSGSSVDVKRQASAHAHQIAIVPDTSFAVVPDLGSDRLYLYQMNRGSLVRRMPEFVTVRPGMGPRHMAFHPSGRFGYLLGELDASVNLYKIDPHDLSLQFVSSTPLNGNRKRRDDQPAGIAMDRSGRFLYCSNRGCDELVVYAVGVDGQIELRQQIACGLKTPRHFAIGPTEDYVFIAGQDSDRIQVFRRDTYTGMIVGTDICWEVPQPSCVLLCAGHLNNSGATMLKNTTPVRRSRDGAGAMQIAELFALDEAHKVRVCRQIGIRHAIVTVTPATRERSRDQYASALKKVKEDFEAAGMVFAGVESHPVPADRIKLGLPGRDEEIENYMEAIRVLARLGVPMVCYNWMAGLGWLRTRTDLPTRGGALTSEFDQRAAEAQGLTEWGVVPESRIWDNLAYFLRAIMPVAEEVGMKMALHPDDPPLSPLRGIGRILTSAEAFRKVMKMYESPLSGIAFCQANFKLMGEDIAALAREWGSQKKLFFVHLRDVEGTLTHFHETFHDDGPVDLAQMLRIYHESGFDGPIRPDHAPTLDEESNDRPGYSIGGKIFAVGYMKGVMDAFGIPYR